MPGIIIIIFALILWWHIRNYKLKKKQKALITRLEGELNTLKKEV
jgi:hypothetical protein